MAGVMTKTISNSVVSVLEIVQGSDCAADGVLTIGTLLKWMDIVACLAAERHCRTNSVTISMDEVDFPSDAHVRVGQAVSLTGQVNNAFNTSMEVGVAVSTEDLQTGQQQTVCLAFFIFVALDHSGKKMKVEQVVPESLEERHEHALANERRTVRLMRKQLEAEALAHPMQLGSPSKSFGAQQSVRRPSSASSNSQMLRGGAAPLLSAVSTELVLPNHVSAIT